MTNAAMDEEERQRLPPRRGSVIGTAENEATARAAAVLAEGDLGKLKYLRKKRRQAVCSKVTRWIAAFTAVTCTTMFFTIILAYLLCEGFNMAVSCSADLKPGDRLPVLAIIVGSIAFVFWAVDVCWAGIVRRKLFALADKEANDMRKKQKVYDTLGIKEAGKDDPDITPGLSTMGAKLKAEAEAAKKKQEKQERKKKERKKLAASGSYRARQKQDKINVLASSTGLDAERLEKFKEKLTAKDLARMHSSSNASSPR
jgi:hypothetical protein